MTTQSALQVPSSKGTTNKEIKMFENVWPEYSDLGCWTREQARQVEAQQTMIRESAEFIEAMKPQPKQAILRSPFMTPGSSAPPVSQDGLWESATAVREWLEAQAMSSVNRAARVLGAMRNLRTEKSSGALETTPRPQERHGHYQESKR